MAALNTRTFKSGNSEALRLPKGYGFGVGRAVRLERRGAELVVTPVAEKEELTPFQQMLRKLATLPAPDYVEERIGPEPPERPGL
ncbi:antitoxin [Sandaracinobacteroides saxicola]|uniref:AbrB/MazE/SpoVT family DNA-binding domain-containing protein n=1 Tax=Sandaracinobacteroides saxicola TaxID=2759707 RepID=A0A7G5II12_9SPHN|nr:AbrB/MazE/SpoVT family DNA-binding domain-containing protein [Sandaracinobacteroides saxicola]QMW23004.1 AbrB/MazE/SpoVT family DNA-binding domain-containing protein [Sandaracinobacteroides saxicola]